MYYFYYKQIVESETPFEGFNKLKEDGLSEYNNTIDATTKYNLFPEVTKIKRNHKNPKINKPFILNSLVLDFYTT